MHILFADCVASIAGFLTNSLGLASQGQIGPGTSGESGKVIMAGNKQFNEEQRIFMALEYEKVTDYSKVFLVRHYLFTSLLRPSICLPESMIMDARGVCNL